VSTKICLPVGVLVVGMTHIATVKLSLVFQRLKPDFEK
jgi:hypothetical protein